MLNTEINIKLRSLAESVRAEILFDLDFKIDITEFFRLRFLKEREDINKLNKAIYKC